MNMQLYFKNLILFLFLFISFKSFSATYYVNDGFTTNDVYTSAIGNNGNPGTSSAPFATLKYALTKAGNNDIIYIDAGVYYRTDEDLTVTQSGLKIIGVNSLLTIFDDNKNGLTGHSFIKIRANNVTIQDFWIKRYTLENGVGQAIDITTAAYTGINITRIKVDNNGATTGAYPIEIGNGSSVTITGGGGTCNQTWENSGGIHVSGVGTNVAFYQYLFLGNDRSDAGSALYVSSGTVNIYSSIFTSNSVHQDQPASCIYITGGAVNVYDCLIDNNTYDQSNNDIGSTIKVTGGTFRITRSKLTNNIPVMAAANYGTIGITGGTVTIDSCYFNGNNAGRAKDIYAKGGTTQVRNCTFVSSGNVIGGALGTITIFNSGNPTINASYKTGVTLSNTNNPTYTVDLNNVSIKLPNYKGDCLDTVRPCASAEANATAVACPSTSSTITVTYPSSSLYFLYSDTTKIWIDSASTSTPTFTVNGINSAKTYYVKASVDPCAKFVPVSISYTSCCSNTLNYTGSPFCQTGSASPTVSPASAGVYSCTVSSTGTTSDLVINSSTGVVDLVNSKPGTYTVKCSITAGICEPTASITITAKPAKPAIGAITQPTCTTSGTVTVTNFDNTQTYGFTPSSGISINTTTGVITATSGTYKIAASKGGCTSDSVSVTFNNVPGKPTISGAQTICVGQAITLTGSGTAVSWATSSNAIATVVNAALNTTTVTGIGSGTATITYTDNSNCTQTASIQVDPTAVGGVATATSANLCTNTTTTINLAGNNGTIQWQSSPDGSTNWTNIGGATSSSLTTPSLTTGNYYYRALITSGVCVSTATSNVVTITVSPTPVVGVASATPDTLCTGNTALLKLIGSTGSIQWQESANGSTGWVNIVGATGGTTANCTTAALNTTTYYKAIVSSGACSPVESTVLKVVVNPNIAASVTIDSDQTETAGEITICPDTKVVFTATPSLGLGTVNYQWKNKGVNIPLATKSTYSSAGLIDGDLITCEITTVGGKCITGSPALSNQIKVNVLVNDLSLIGNSPTSCNLLDGSINVKGTGVGTVKWAFSSTPLVNLGTLNGVTLTKVAPYITINGLGKGNYTVTFNNGTCDFTKDVTLTDPSAPQDPLLSVNNLLPLCQGQSVTISATVADPLSLTGTTKYHWTKDGLDYTGAVQPQVGNSITVNIAGTYSVTLEDGACSSNSNDTVISITSTPVVPTTSNTAPTFCKSDNKKVTDLTTSLTNASKTITWYDLAVGGTAFNSSDVLSTRTYFAEQSEGTCKSASRLQVNVTVVDVTAPTLPGAISQPTCSVPTGIVDINLPSSGVWNITATPIVGAPTQVTTGNLTTNPFTYQFAGLNSGTYTFKVMDVNGCLSPVSSSAVIQNQPTSPSTPVLDPSKIYCASNSYTLDQIAFNPTGSVKYYDVNDIAISPKTIVVAGTTYKFTFDNGTCESKVKLATVIPFDAGPPIAPVDISNAATICAIDKPTFNSLISMLPITVPAGYSLLISPSSTGNPVIPNSSVIGSLGGITQTIYYNIVNDKGCQNKNFSTLKFVINEGPTDLVLKNGIQPLCASDNPTVLDLDKTKISGTGTLKWYTSDVSTTALPSNTKLSNGTYYASATANPGCESINRKPVIVEVQSFGQTTLDGSNDYTFCKDIDKKVSDLQTTPYQSNAIVWLNANKIVQAPNMLLIPGTYYAAETKNNCVSDKPQEIEVKFTSPTISISPKKLPTCSIGNGSFVITGANDTYTYKWSKNGVQMSETGAQINNLADDQTAKYSVIVTDSKGCIAKDTATFSDCDPALPPHIITPNGDGKNDNFVLHYDQKYPKCQLYIYNRWGALVYTSQIPYKDEWDGKSNASDALGKDVLPASTYFYMIEKGDGTDPESGYIELVK